MLRWGECPVFTAGIGENSPLIRSMVCEGLEFLGIELDAARNNEALEREQLISSPHSKVKVLVIPTNEELMIAMDTIALAFPHQQGFLETCKKDETA